MELIQLLMKLKTAVLVARTTINNTTNTDSFGLVNQSSSTHVSIAIGGRMPFVSSLAHSSSSRNRLFIILSALHLPIL